MNKALPLFAAETRAVGIAEDESDGCEEIRFARTITTDNHIQFWRERVDDSLILVTNSVSMINTVAVSPRRTF